MVSWPEPEQVERREVYLVDKPGAAQSEIRIGRVGAPRLTADYYALVVMNTILGGAFTSRLNQNLREEHGYSYGAYSFFDFEPLPGPFVASAAVQTAVTDSALVEFMKELRGILEPVTDEELERAKNYVALRFPSRFQTVAGIARQIAQIELYGLPDTYFNDYVDRILAVTRADVLRVARKYIDPDRVAIVVVGDRSKIEGGVRALELGPLRLLTVEDVLGPPPVLTGTQ
jgi:predicted Zn-dependent peptidase